MKVSELKEKLCLKVAAGEGGLIKDANGCFAGDLLSLVMAKLEQDNVWVTIQTNINTVAVASLKDAACIIIAEGFMPDENTKSKADTENIPILVSEESMYSLCGKLWELSI